MAIVEENLIAQYSAVHGDRKSWGKSAHRYLSQIQACVAELKPAVILEYGCGKSELCNQLDYGTAAYHRYDPAIPHLDKMTVGYADLLINTDVLEHIPRADIPDVLRHMRSLTERVFFYVCTRPASTILPNGQNAHCTLLQADEWLALIRAHFDDAHLVHVDPAEGCIIITWYSQLDGVLREIQDLKITAGRYKALTRPWYKKLEIAFRRLRDRVLRRAGRYARSR
jgi:hypothetical protein